MRRWILAMCLGVMAGTAGAQSVAGQWRVGVGGDAESDGRIMLELSPEIGQPIRATAQVDKGRSEGEMATHLRDALRLALGDGYAVEAQGDEVRVVKRGDSRDFVIAMVENTVQGVNLDIAAD